MLHLGKWQLKEEIPVNIQESQILLLGSVEGWLDSETHKQGLWKTKGVKGSLALRMIYQGGWRWPTLPEYVRQSCLSSTRGIIWEVEGGRTGSLPLPSPCPEEPGLCCHFWFMDAHICKWAAVHGLFPRKLGGNRFFNQPWDSYTMRWQFRICGWLV